MCRPPGQAMGKALCGLRAVSVRWIFGHVTDLTWPHHEVNQAATCAIQLLCVLDHQLPKPAVAVVRLFRPVCMRDTDTHLNISDSFEVHDRQRISLNSADIRTFRCRNLAEITR
jgi:hypothetical protein